MGEANREPPESSRGPRRDVRSPGAGLAPRSPGEIPCGDPVVRSPGTIPGYDPRAQPQPQDNALRERGSRAEIPCRDPVRDPLVNGYRRRFPSTALLSRSRSPDSPYRTATAEGMSSPRDLPRFIALATNPEPAACGTKPFSRFQDSSTAHGFHSLEIENLEFGIIDIEILTFLSSSISEPCSSISDVPISMSHKKITFQF